MAKLAEVMPVHLRDVWRLGGLQEGPLCWFTSDLRGIDANYDGQIDLNEFVTTLLDWDELQKQQTWQPLPFLPHAPAATFSTFRLGLYLLPTPAKYNHHTTHFKISPLLWPVHTALSKLALPLVLRSCACRSITPGCTHLAVSHQQTNMLRVSVQLSARERLMMHAPRICLQTYIDTAFNKIDTDGDGYISLEELMDLIPAQPRVQVDCCSCCSCCYPTFAVIITSIVALSCPDTKQGWIKPGWCTAVHCLVSAIC
eukprot:1150342-Pelagomonas_calceolata.AAC.19